MKIFPAEKNLEKEILASDVFSCVIKADLGLDMEDKFIDYLENSIQAKDNKVLTALEKMGVKEHPFLMYGSAIFASIGMNGNDDIFLPDEVKSSYKSIIHNPVNTEHKKKRIIGNIFGARLVDKEYKELDESKDLPDFYHVETSFAIYKSIFPNTSAKIEKDYREGKAFISLEGWIESFDYGVVDGEKISIVKRDETTAGLTKHLRMFGGTGTFQGKKIGRVLRNIVFKGLGVVPTPANKHSEFTDLVNASIEIEQESGKYATENTSSVLISSKDTFVIHEGLFEMKVKTVKSVEEATEVIAELQERIEALEAGETESLKNELEASKAKATELENKVSSLEAQLDTIQSDRDEKAQALETVKAELDTAKQNLESIEAENRKTQRLGRLEQLGVKVTAEKEEKFLGMTDEAFELFSEEIASRLSTKTDETNASDEGKEEETPGSLETEANQENEEEANTEQEVQSSLQNRANNVAATLVSAIRNSKRSNKR